MENLKARCLLNINDSTAFSLDQSVCEI